MHTKPFRLVISGSSLVSIHIIISFHIISYHIISVHHTVDLKRQNVLKVRTNKPKLKVKMQSVSDDDARKNFWKSHVFPI